MLMVPRLHHGQSEPLTRYIERADSTTPKMNEGPPQPVNTNCRWRRWGETKMKSRQRGNKKKGYCGHTVHHQVGSFFFFFLSEFFQRVNWNINNQVHCDGGKTKASQQQTSAASHLFLPRQISGHTAHFTPIQSPKQKASWSMWV